MTKHQGQRAGIIGIGSYVPDRVLTNADLEKMVETTDEWIVTRTGISERRIAADDQAASDFAVAAGRAALASAGLEPKDIDLVICATITGDMPFPATASIVQEKLGIQNSPAFDLHAGCSGFIYSLAVADSCVRSGAYGTILVIGVDLLSRITDWTDRSTCVLFGDASGAAVVGSVGEGEGLLSFHLGSDGSGAELLKLEAGGSRLPPSLETVQNRRHYLYMNGREVFKFAVRIMGDAAVEALNRAGLKPGDVDVFVPHQANIRIIDAAAERLGVPSEKVYVNVQRYGNTSAASIPLALDEAYRSGLVKKGSIVVAVGFGAGLTYGATVVRWGMDPPR